MSDAVMDSPRLNGPVPPAAPSELVQPPGGFDIVAILWRWKWLPILGSLIGASLGFLYFSQQPATYQAMALVQVVNSTPAPSRNQFFDPAERSISRADESLVIRSKTVLRRAVISGNLDELPEFITEATGDEKIDRTVAALQDENSPLVIEPADKDDNTTLITITYISQDQDSAHKVVTAIVQGYKEYLEDEYKTVGQELTQLLSDAKQSLFNEFNTLSEENQKFQASQPRVVWNGDEAFDPYTQNYTSLNKQLSEVRVQRQKMETVFNRVRKGLEEDRPAEPLLLMLTAAGSNFQDQENWYDRSSAALDDPDFDYKMDLESARIEREVLFPLQIKEKLFLDTLGESHPSVSTVQKQIELTQKQVAQLREAERRLNDEITRIKDEAKEKNGIKPLSIQERLNTRLIALGENIQNLKEQEQSLQALADENMEKSKELRVYISRNRFMNEQLEATKTLLAGYTEKLQEMDLMPKVNQRTLKELDMPTSAGFYGPKIPIYLLGGAAAGFILLSGLAVLMDLADRSYRNPSEISSDLGVAVLGHIPIMNVSKSKKSIEFVDNSVCTIHHSKGRVSEAYRTVRTGLYFSNRGKSLKVLQVTSPVPGDGKSTLSSNIAVTMAQSGRRVLLIDADLRRPRVAKIFGIESDIGVAAVVMGKAEVEDAIQAGPVPNLSILPGGKRPSNPAEILCSDNFKNMIDMLRDKFDIIVIDTPPLLAVSDPGAVAGIVDGVLMTMRLRRNVRPLAERAKAILESVGANLLGVVINGVSSEAGNGYNYDYNDYRYAYKYGSNYRSGYGYRYGYGNYRYGYTEDAEPKELSKTESDS